MKRAEAREVATTPSIQTMPAHLIRRCHQIAVSLFHEECPEPLTPIQFAVLALLRQYDGIDQITLAGLAALNRSTAGEVVARMEGAGLLRRADDPTDRRVKNVFLTRSGLRLLARVEGSIERVQQRLLAPLDKDERARFLDCLSRIARDNNDLSRAPMRAPG
jgi:DNA-binding MarR family transcriptional regulator